MKQVILFWSLFAFSSLLFAQTAFRENKGQIVDQLGKPNTEALYVLPLKGMNVVLRADGFSYDVFEIKPFDQNQATLHERSSLGEDVFSSPQEKTAVHRVDVFFDGQQATNIQAEPSANGARFHYYTTGTPKEGVHGVQDFHKITYLGVYEGIDVEFVAGGAKGFEYNFIVHPHADVNQIALRYTGPLGMALKENQLYLDLSTNDVVEHIPASYFMGSGQQIDVNYQLEKDVLSFIAPDFAPNETLVIDPTPNLVHATYYGGPNRESMNNSDIDTQGSIYMSGETTSATNLATSGAFQTEYGGSSDVVVIKFDPSYNLEWATYMGGDLADFPSDLIIHDNTLFVNGSAASNNVFASSDAFQDQIVVSPVSLGNAFLCRFSLSGERIWGTYFGTGGESFRSSVILNNQILVAVGGSRSSTLPFENNPYQSELNGTRDGLISFWTLDGTPVYCSYFGGDDSDLFNQVTQSESGLIWMSGNTWSSSGVTNTSSWQQSYGGGSDCFLVAFNENFEFLYSTYFGTESDDYNTDLTADGHKIILCGSTGSGADLVTADAFQINENGNTDAFYAIFNEEFLELEYCTLLGGNVYESNLMVLPYENELFFVGSTNSDQDLTTPGAFQEDFMDSGATNNWKLFLGKMNADNQIEWCSYFGNYGYVDGATIHLYNNKLILTGLAGTTSLLPEEMQIPFSTPNAFQPDITGEFDAFFAVFDGVTGVEIQQQEARFSVFPNPARDVLNLSLPYRDNWRLEIFNSQGQLVQTERLSQVQNGSVHIQHLPASIYQIRCTSVKGHTLHQQVVVR
jgi:hypothetical protein